MRIAVAACNHGLTICFERRRDGLSKAANVNGSQLQNDRVY